MLIVAALLAATCRKPTETTSAGGHGQTITVGNYFYAPNPDTAHAGTITFTWAEPSAGHSVYWDRGPQGLPSIGKVDRGSYSMSVDSVGTYQFHCDQHPAEMIGILVVVP